MICSWLKKIFFFDGPEEGRVVRINMYCTEYIRMYHIVQKKKKSGLTF